MSAQTYVATVTTLNGGSYSGSSYISLGGYYAAGDGGGGMLVQGPSGCTPNGGSIFKDSGTTCFYRYNPTNDVREWGAYCDVTAISSGSATWNPTLGAVVIKTSLLTPRMPATGEYISISQIGGPSLWALGTATAHAAVTLTRWTTLSATGANYASGDLISFQGHTTPGSFSQQAAIIVDSVDSNGAIVQWHFLWGGVYDATVTLPDGPMGQDDTRSHCAHTCGTGHASGAALTPAWSGWSVQDGQSLPATGSGFSVGDTVTLGGSGATVNQGQNPVLIVEGTGAGGVVTRWDWLNYGSFSTLPTTPGTLSQTATSGSGLNLSFTSVQWTRGPLATTISNVATDGTDPHSTDIFLTDVSAYPASQTIVYFYYGHDDGAAINAALGQGVASHFSLPAACGSTMAINLPNDTSGNNLNAALVGQNFQSTGLYAFALPLSHRGDGGAIGYTPVLGRLIYKDTSSGAFGGGFSNMLVEALGIPEGYGYWGLYPSGASPPTGYVGPAGTSTPTIPTAGDVVEIDGGKYLRINNVHIENAQGIGNAIFQCGLDESDPTNVIGSSVYNISFGDSRIDNDGAATPLPDFTLKIGNSCHDSTFANLTAFDGTKADVFVYDGNVFSQIHVNSGAGGANAQATGTITWPANTRLAGVADYGVYAIGNTSLAQTQCDIANFGCVLMQLNAANAVGNPGQITDTQMKCGTLPSVPPTYYGVELPNDASNITVSGTASANRCGVPAAQLIHLDGAIASTVSLCNNSNATVVACGGGGTGFAAGRYYTQPALAYTTTGLMGGTGTGASTLYAVPFFNPSGGTITKIGIQVTGTGTATRCDLGVYSGTGGAPGALLLDAGAVVASGGGMKTNTGLNLVLLPDTLYFLAVGCDGTVTVEATGSSSGLTGVLTGLSDFTTSASTSLSVAWTYAAHGLPASFGTPTYTASTVVPNVYVGS